MKIKVIFPTRSRPDKFLNVLKKYHEYAHDLDNMTFVVNCDENDETTNNIEFIKKVGEFKNTHLYFDDNNSKIQACNRNVDENGGYDILMLASDDMVPVKKGYDKIVRLGFEKYIPDLDGVLHFNDGIQGKRLNTLCILGRKYYNRFGYIYHPSYMSLYCDQEFTQVSKKLDKQVYVDNIIIRHEHHAHGYCSVDDLYDRNEAYCSQDEHNFMKRYKNNFDL